MEHSSAGNEAVNEEFQFRVYGKDDELFYIFHLKADRLKFDRLRTP